MEFGTWKMKHTVRMSALLYSLPLSLSLALSLRAQATVGVHKNKAPPTPHPTLKGGGFTVAV